MPSIRATSRILVAFGFTFAGSHGLLVSPASLQRKGEILTNINRKVLGTPFKYSVQVSSESSGYVGDPRNLNRMRLQGRKMTSDESTNLSKASTPLSSLNLGLIGQNLGNQFLLGITIWTGGAGYQALAEKTEFGPWGIIVGLLGLVPLLGLSRAIETSESYVFSGLNLSTNMAVLRLFGPTPQPIVALFFSALMSGLTGVVEEVTFRGQLLPAFASRFADGDLLTGALLSSLLFAFLHTNPSSFLKGGEAALDNFILLALQFVNGSIFAGLYLVAGENLAAPIIAHALYDFYTFYKTHLVDVAGQMEYAQQQATTTTTMMPQFKSRALEQKWIDQRGNDFVKGVKQSFYLMDTNRDGVLSRKELRVALFSYGINLSRLQSEDVTRKADIDQSGAIDLDEFLEFVGPSGSTSKAVRNTLFGPL